MERRILDASQVQDEALKTIGKFHHEVINEVEKEIRKHDLVVVGMAQNPFVKKVKVALDAAGLTYHYLEYGSYFSMWKPRLAIKMWSGWPTYPQVFLKGQLIGGYQETVRLLEQGVIQAKLK